MHPWLFKLEMVTHWDQQSVGLWVRDTEVNQMAHHPAQLIKHQVLLIFKLHILSRLTLLLGLWSEQPLKRTDTFFEKIAFFRRLIWGGIQLTKVFWRWCTLDYLPLFCFIYLHGHYLYDRGSPIFGILPELMLGNQAPKVLLSSSINHCEKIVTTFKNGIEELEIFCLRVFNNLW